jgi:hypothetical protein
MTIGGGGGHLKLRGREEKVRRLKIKEGAVVEGAHREGVVAVVAASTLAPSTMNLSTGADKRRWGVVGLRARPGGRRKGVRGNETDDGGARHFLKLVWQREQWGGGVLALATRWEEKTGAWPDSGGVRPAPALEWWAWVGGATMLCDRPWHAWTGEVGAARKGPGTVSGSGVKRFKPFSNLNDSKTFKIFPNLTDPKLIFSCSEINK